MNNVVEILIQDKLKENISFNIFFMGLAKNTGKTTAFNYVMSLLEKLTKQSVILISTGYDGEESDAVSGLSKPKIKLSQGNAFITAEHLLPNSKSHYKILKKFTFQTPFGKIILVEALNNLTVSLVSPGNNEKLCSVINYIKSIFGKPIFLIDGSLNRKAFLNLATIYDLLILSTGAAFSTDLQEHITEIDFLYQLFSIPQSAHKSNYKWMEIIDDATAKLMKNEKILLPDISSVFMTPQSYSKFIAANNKLFYEQLPPALSFVTINPFNPLGKQISQKQFLFSLQNRFPNISFVDIHQLQQC